MWAVLVLWVVFSTSFAFGDEKDWFVYLGNRSKPKAPPKQISAAEALPPLPLPATPLRRTERKKPPQPDYLIGKVIWGESASFTDSNGDKMDIADWNLCPSDLQRLVETARQLKLQYHWHNVNLSDFHFDPKKLPSLLFSGVRTLRLSDTHVEALRRYVLDGGMIICDSIAGSPYFYDSAKGIFLQAFPESRFRIIALDHPIYHMLVDIDKAKYARGGSQAPFLEAIYVGSRVGVLLSKFGLGCGWNRDLERLGKLPEAAYYDTDSAGEIGLNLAAYIVGYAEAGQVEARPEIYGAADNRRPTDEFVFAQLKHDGVWNVHPTAATALLATLREHTTVRVNLKRVGVDPNTDDLSAYPFLYMTGMDSFAFSAEAVAALRRYVQSGGVLMINNGLGLGTFDQALRRELARILPEGRLEPLGARHDLYSSLFSITRADHTPALQRRNLPHRDRPYLLAIFLGGDLRVLYSPYDLEAGWLSAEYPLINGYEQAGARQLGMNIITYVMTH